MKYYTEDYNLKKGHGNGFGEIGAVDAKQALMIGLDQFRSLCRSDQKEEVVFVYESYDGNMDEAAVIGEFKLNHTLSLNNGMPTKTFYELDESDFEYINEHWDALTELMDKTIRNNVLDIIAPCTNEEFLERYLKDAPADLIIG